MKAAAILVLVAALPATSALAEEKFSNDDLCRAIGETSKAALQPRDRLFFEKNCVCFETLGCMGKGTPRAKAAEAAAVERARAEAARRKAAAEARRAAQAKAKAAAEKRAVTDCAPRNDAYSACAQTPGRDCMIELVELHGCCVDAGVPNQASCLDLFP